MLKIYHEIKPCLTIGKQTLEIFSYFVYTLAHYQYILSQISNIVYFGIYVCIKYILRRE